MCLKVKDVDCFRAQVSEMSEHHTLIGERCVALLHMRI